jgi:CMP-N,N'-diacetyllegionaminic acid synthase
MVGRGGSRGVPRKNLRRIGEWSLIEWKARGALRARDCTRIVMTSDDEEIRAEARRLGCETPFVRPAELATDTAKPADVVLHALEWLDRERGETFDAVMLLEPSAPFTRPSDYDAATELFASRDATLVVGVREVQPSTIFVGPLGKDGSIADIADRVERMTDARRQATGLEVTMNGGLYLFRTESLRRTKRIYTDPQKCYGHLMDDEYSVEIDGPRDLAWAEFLFANGHIDTSLWK